MCRLWALSSSNDRLGGSKGNGEKITVAFCPTAMLHLSPPSSRARFDVALTVCNKSHLYSVLPERDAIKIHHHIESQFSEFVNLHFQ